MAQGLAPCILDCTRTLCSQTWRTIQPSKACRCRWTWHRSLSSKSRSRTGCTLPIPYPPCKCLVSRARMGHRWRLCGQEHRRTRPPSRSPPLTASLQDIPRRFPTRLMPWHLNTSPPHTRHTLSRPSPPYTIPQDMPCIPARPRLLYTPHCKCSLSSLCCRLLRSCWLGSCPHTDQCLAWLCTCPPRTLRMGLRAAQTIPADTLPNKPLTKRCREPTCIPQGSLHRYHPLGICQTHK